MKIKGEEYVRLHKIMTDVSTKSVWNACMNHVDMGEFLKDVPDEYYEKIREYEYDIKLEFKNKENQIISEYRNIVEKLGNVSNKEFALFIKNNKNKSYFFALRNGKDIESAIWKSIQPEFRKL